MNYQIKKFIIIIIFLLIPFNVNAKSWTNNWTLNGIKISEIDNIKDIGIISASFISTSAIHWIGHYTMAKSLGINFQQKGFVEILPNNMNKSDRFLFDISGFGLQLIAGSFLKYKYNDSLFTKSYNLISSTQIITYPIYHYNDNKNYDNFGDFSSGSGDATYFIFTGWSLLNFSD